MSLYQTLGIDPKATQADIKATYRRKSKEAHPDREGGSNEAMAAINDAYAILSDPERRTQYDQTGNTGKEQTEEDYANAALVDAFTQSLTHNGDIVKMVKDGFKEAVAIAIDDIHRVALATAKLKKRRGLVECKHGNNLYQMILDAKITDCEKQIALCEKRARVANIALDMMKAYQFKGEVAPEPMRDGPQSPLFHYIAGRF